MHFCTSILIKSKNFNNIKKTFKTAYLEKFKFLKAFCKLSIQFSLPDSSPGFCKKQKKNIQHCQKSDIFHWSRTILQFFKELLMKILDLYYGYFHNFTILNFFL